MPLPLLAAALYAGAAGLAVGGGLGFYAGVNTSEVLLTVAVIFAALWAFGLI